MFRKLSTLVSGDAAWLDRHHLRSGESYNMIYKFISNINTVDEVLKYAGPIFFAALLFKIIMVARNIHKRQSVGSEGPFMFISLFSNSLAWTLYGELKTDDQIYASQSAGIAVSMLCLAIYHYNREKPTDSYSPPTIMKEYVYLIVTCSATAFLYYYRFTEYLGLLGCFLLMAMTASPLGHIQIAIENKKNSELPFNTNLMFWLNSLVWMAYGAVSIQDPFIYGPNILSMMVSTIQMLICVLISST